MELFETVLVYVYLGVLLTLGAFLKWLGKEGLTQYFTSKLKLDFDTRLTKIQSEFRQAETRLIADLNQKTQEIASLRDGTLSNSRLRSHAEYERRVLSLDGIWKAFIEHKKFAYAANFSSMIDFDSESAKIKGNPDLAAAFHEMTKALTLEEFNKISSGEEFRPHVSDAVWHLFSAYRTVLHGSIVVISVVRIGKSPRPFSEDSTLDSILKHAFPELEKLGKRIDFENVHLILAPLESKILITIKKELRGEDFSSSEILEAAKIKDAISSMYETNGARL
ncbi:MAG: hypothetical protein E6Q75_13270 [Rheinheimera sp.]|nr:MAG: hypothetical protein E6Q75_13270 [Rheinheimera sp.]